MVNRTCPVCHGVMGNGLETWHLACDECGYEMSELEPAINKEVAHVHIDEQFREEGLRSVRAMNFKKLLESITSVIAGSTNKRLLDVGCAHGWFLEAAKESGFDVLGIEPDMAVYKSSVKRGLPIRRGFFPDALEAKEQFDVIVFNDVFEHIPEVVSVLNDCANHLKPSGILVLNLPSSSGLFYKVARLLSRLGITGFFERLWQKGFPSPHVHYFNPDNLSRLLKGNGFEIVTSGRLSSVQLKGLYTRISYDKKSNLPVRLLTWLSVLLVLPLTKMMPSDIIYVISTRGGG